MNSSFKLSGFDPRYRSILSRSVSTFSRDNYDNYQVWKAVKGILLSDSQIQLIRLDCLNPIKAIKYQPKLDTKVKSVNPLKSLNNINVYQGSVQVTSMGVRDSINSLFSVINRLNYKLLIPNDVYPVYSQIALKNMIQFDTYTSVNKSIDYIFKTYVNQYSYDKICILMTIPHVPTGKLINDDDTNIIIDWLTGDKKHILIIDCVYTYDFSIYQNQFAKLFNTQQVILCNSLSKSFLLPLHYGIIHLPKRLSNWVSFLKVTKPTSDLVNKTEGILQSCYNLPEYQMDFFKSKWVNLKPLITSIYPKWQIPENGYLSTLPIDYRYLFQKHNVLAIPSHVYSTNTADLDIQDKPYSIISCLYDNDIERKKYHVTRVSNFSRGFDKYTRIYDKSEITENSFKDKFFLLNSNDLNIGFDKTRNSLAKNNSVDDKLLVLETNIPYQQTIYNSGNNKGQYIKSNRIQINNVHQVNEDDSLIQTDVENAYSLSMKINNKNLIPYTKLNPRTISILPIAKGCQAKCPFCFSHSSISSEQKQSKLSFNKIEKLLVLSKERGAERAVITGGGEPMMLQFGILKEMINLCSKHFGKVIMITNGYALGKLDDELRLRKLLELQGCGLSVLSISRHGIGSDNNTNIMFLNTMSEKIADTFKRYKFIFNTLILRWVCVLQKGGVYDEYTLEKYLDWVIETGVNQICFKELYVASSYESVYYNEKTNIWSRENQVPLNLVVNYLEKNGGKIKERLPWGSPIYEFNRNSHKFIIAAYTEPSVYWERINGICRSWNIMSDGKCYASLEDNYSLIFDD